MVSKNVPSKKHEHEQKPVWNIALTNIAENNFVLLASQYTILRKHTACQNIDKC